MPFTDRHPAWLAVGLVPLAMAAAVGLLAAVEPALGLAAGAAALYGAVVLRSPALAVALWVPAFSLTFVPAGNALLRVGFPAALLAVAVARMRAPAIPSPVWRHRGWLTAVLVLFAWVLGSVVWAAEPHRVLSEAWKAALAVFAALAIVAVVRRREHALWLVAALVAGPVLSAALGLVGGSGVEGFAAGTNTFGRLTGGAGDANQLAAGLVPAIALALGLFVAVRHPAARLAAAAAVGVSVIGIAASESRGGLIGLCALMVFLLVLLRGARAVLVLVMVGALAAAAVYVAASPHSLDRITSFDAEGTGRADLWRVAWQMALDNPLGVGLDNFRAVSGEYAQAVGPITQLHHFVDRPVVAHSTYLQLLAESGVVGVVLFAGVVVAALRSALRAARLFERAGDVAMAVVARASAAALLGFLVAAAFISFAFSYRMWALLALGPALLSVAAWRGDAHVASGGHDAAS